MQEKEIYFKKAKFWNMVCLILKILSEIATVIVLIPMFTLKKEMFESLGSEGIEQYNQLTSISSKVSTILSLIVGIVLIVFYIIANKKLKNMEEVSKFPYYISMGFFVISTIYGQFTAQTSDFGLMSIVGLIIGIFCAFLPPIMVLRNLFKLDSED
ncbi:hypothetical protein BG262_07150 [Floricoccus penangensis]|uniref:Uncharacterized protein n=1 Tax=Floricoccus penangensis TaxID=1859475 RepID=A0A9Q5JF79_9LACT|nr:hypothetical protein [Floricoccus penangensis]OFI45768.1 hypothetical protein BG262_07150 [Floricoccus penangensis]